MSKPTIVICGSIALDRVLTFDKSFSDIINPERLDVLSASILIDDHQVVYGGTGANIAYYAALLGAKPALSGVLGKTDKDYIQHLKDAGVNTDGVYLSDMQSASFTVITDANGNQIGGFHPGAMSDSDSLNFNMWHDRDALVCISAHDPDAMRRQVNECVDSGLKLMYDPGQQVTNLSGEDLKAGCEAAKMILVNEYELSILSKKTDMMEQELKELPEIFITTYGKDGALIQGRAMVKPIEVKAAKPYKIVDHTGAGDALRGGMLYGLSQGWEITEAVRLGSVMASFNLEISGQEKNFTKANVEDRYKKEFGEEIKL